MSDYEDELKAQIAALEARAEAAEAHNAELDRELKTASYDRDMAKAKLAEYTSGEASPTRVASPPLVYDTDWMKHLRDCPDCRSESEAKRHEARRAQEESLSARKATRKTEPEAGR